MLPSQLFQGSFSSSKVCPRSVRVKSDLHHVFPDELPTTLLTELIPTSLVFVTSANREIVKSALGFVKLVITTLPVELVSPHLTDFVSALLRWSHDHKNHFKVKVRHIFERMIRRFGWESVESAANNTEGADEGKKVLTNIKKRRDRAKRKKAQKDEERDDNEVDDHEEEVREIRFMCGL